MPHGNDYCVDEKSGAKLMQKMLYNIIFEQENFEINII